MKKRIIITAVVLAVIHLVFAIGSVVVAYGSKMEAFEIPDYEPSVIERGADHLSGILMQPGRSLWTPWMSKNMPGIVEWGLCIANSLLWGFAITFLTRVRALRMKKQPDNKSMQATAESAAPDG